MVQNLGVAQVGAQYPHLLPHSYLPLVEKEGEEQMEGIVPVTPDTWDHSRGGHLDLR